MNSPHREEAKGTGLVRRRGRNRKTSSALPEFLSSVSLSSDVGLANYDHLRAHRSETKLPVPFLRREVAGGGKWRSEVTRKRREEAVRVWASQPFGLIRCF